MIRLCAFADEAAADLAGQIAALKRNGIALLELRSVAGKNVRDLTLDEARDIAAELAAAGIGVWSIGSPIGKVDVTVDFSEYEKTVRHVCELAGVFGTKYVRMFSFHKAYDSAETVFAHLARMVEIAQEYGVTLCHENEKGIYGDTVARTVEVLDRVPGLACVYDPANFLQVGERADVSLAALAPRAMYFHIKDVITATGELVPAGYGDGQIEKLVAGIKGDKVLTLEPHLASFGAYKTIDDTEMKHRFHFATNTEAFDAAAAALKEILARAGYHEKNGGYEK